MKVLILEDEPLVAKDLERLIAKVAPDAVIMAILGSVSSTIDWLGKHPTPDLILSDIQLADGVSFDVFSKTDLQCPIIFTTAYDEYAIRAFKLNSIDYLLKPVHKEDLSHAFAQFRKMGQPSSFGLRFSQLMDHLKGNGYKERFTAHAGQSLVAVPAPHVATFFRDELIFLLTKDNKRLVTDYKSLEELEECLDPKTFFRANRQCIVHIDAIDHVRSHHTGKLLVSLKAPFKEEITVSREKAGQFKDWFEGG